MGKVKQLQKRLSRIEYLRDSNQIDEFQYGVLDALARNEAAALCYDDAEEEFLRRN